LAERYGMPVRRLLQEMTSADISECMAYEYLKNEDNFSRLNKSIKEHEAPEVNQDSRNAEIKAMFGF
jgi:hypothetical protein